MKKTFNLVAEVKISVYTEVKAETLEDAIKIAEDREIEVSNFHDKNQASEVWVSDDFDGSPENIHES